MKYLPRHLGKRLLEAKDYFKVILLLGARQTGKSTFLHHLLPDVKVVVFLEKDDVLYPIEIKCKSHPSKSDTTGITAFRQTYPTKKIMPGLVIHAGDETFPIDQETLALSWKTL